MKLLTRRSPAADKQWRRGQRASRRWALWGGALGLLIGAIAFLPASWLTGPLQNATGGRLLLADARGTAWSGSALTVLTGGADSRDAAALPDRLHWRLSPRWNGLDAVLRQDCCLRGEVAVALRPSWQGMTLSLPARPEGIGQWPAQWLAGLGTPWNTLQLGGAIRLMTPGFSLQTFSGRLLMNGSLDVELLSVTSRVSPVEPLGSYRLNLRADGSSGESAAITLDTEGGALRLNGTGQWTGSRLRFRGEARAAEGQEVGLANLLNIIGRRQGALSVISIG